MASKESDVRGAIVTAIQGIYSTLGFAESPGNVKPYLFKNELPSKAGEFLSAKIAGETQKRVRAWGVEVIAQELYSAVSEIPTRLYTITVEGYYGAHGSTPINTLIDHALLVRGAIDGLTSRISNTVDRTVSVADLDVSRLETSEVPIEIFVGRMVYSAEKYNPGWT